MYYKVIKNDKVIDLLESLSYVRYDTNRKRRVLCGPAKAEGVLSSDERIAWHVYGFLPFAVDGYDSVQLVEIDENEYHQLKALNGKTPEEIIDEYTLYLLEAGLL